MRIPDSKIKRAIAKSGGKPTVAAKMLGVSYNYFWVLTKDNQELKDMIAAKRAETFYELSELSHEAVRSGTMERKVKGPGGHEHSVFDAVDPMVRLSTATRIMTLTKNDAGIVDKSAVDHTTLGKSMQPQQLIFLDAEALTPEQIDKYLSMHEEKSEQELEDELDEDLKDIW